jgi:ABC-type Fe3+/spermidine/putrescine transport system ATPase subunit
LALNPDVLLLDEPLSNLDAKIRQQVRAEIRKLQKELRVTSIYVTHDQEEALTISDRIAVLNQGTIQQVGLPRDLYERPENAFVADFIGINNLIDGRVETIHDQDGLMTVQTPFGLIQCPDNGRFKSGDICKISVRPETASLSASEDRPEGMNRLSGTISFSSYIGNSIRYDVDLDGRTIFKVDVQNPWNQKVFSLQEKVHVLFPIPITLGIPA